MVQGRSMLMPWLKLLGATPFKRPENGQFQPGSHFRTFFFVITGDTDNRAGIQPELAARGAWGGIFRVDLDAKPREWQHLSGRPGRRRPCFV